MLSPWMHGVEQCFSGHLARFDSEVVLACLVNSRLPRVGCMSMYVVHAAVGASINLVFDIPSDLYY